MAQSLKPELRARLLAAAEQAFAEAGYQGATMAQIADRAGVSTGNVYRYFANKDALFYEVLSPAFADGFLRLVENRVGSLALAQDLTQLDPRAQTDGEELLRFWTEHRLKVIVLLDRAHGSEHERFADRFVELLLKPTLRKLRREADAPLSPVVRALLETLFRNTVRAIVAILESHDRPHEIRQAFAGFWSYQLAGLAAFTKWVRHA